MRSMWNIVFCGFCSYMGVLSAVTKAHITGILFFIFAISIYEIGGTQ